MNYVLTGEMFADLFPFKDLIDAFLIRIGKHIHFSGLDY